MRRLTLAATILCATLLTGCATSFISSWKAPDAQPLQMQGAKIAAIAMVQNPSLRHTAEDTLARELTARGASGVALYSIMGDDAKVDEQSVRAAVEKGGFAGAVVMRPTAKDQEVVSSPTMYMGPSYNRFWGGYYGYGMGGAYPYPYFMGSEIQTNTIVTIETLVYSIPQNKLVWAGSTTTTNPKKADKVVQQTAKKVFKELAEKGLLP